MKRLFALMLFIGLSLAAAAQTPLILDRSSFNYSTDNDSVIVNPTPFSFNTPQEGANMIWDYSNIQKGSTVSYGIFGNNTQRFLNFPLISVDGFEYITATRGYFSDSYYNINDQYYAWTASYVKPQSYFIGDLSGNENDTLSFPGGEYELETPSYYIKFPSTFQSAFSYNTKWLTDFVLTVTNFGINKANGQKKKYYSVSDSVVGWGKLTLPTESGDNASLDVLMSKRIIETTDSIFLNGAPAPQMMLTAFGITQGAVKKTQRYYFWQANNKCPAFVINFPDETFTAPASYYFFKMDKPTGINEELITQNCTIKPNPVSDRVILLDLTCSENSIFELFDLTGRVILSENLNPSAQIHQIQIPEGISAGIFIYRIADDSNIAVHTGKLAVIR